MDKNTYTSPFKGACSYEEKDAHNFCGRLDETEELIDRIEGNYLTVLYGKSGIGKSSLLKAGVMPGLRKLNYYPIYITLDNSIENSYEWQITKKCKEILLKETKVLINDENSSLVELLDIHNWPNDLRPVIVLDQFEELYYHNTSFQRRTSLLSTLHSLIYNKIDKGQISPDHNLITDFRIIISFREDFLCYIEDDSIYLPPLRENRYRLLPLTESQAQIIISCVGEENGIISTQDNMPSKIIKKIHRGGIMQSLSYTKEPTIDAFTLSLYCQQLDNLRYSNHLKCISDKLVNETSPSEILFTYYKNTLETKSQNCTLLIEDYLLDEEGRKRKIHKDNAFAIGVKSTDLISLISDGIIRETDNGLIEIGHDRICEVAFRNKALRLQNREKWIYFFILFPFYAFIAFCAYYMLNGIMSQVCNVLDWLDYTNTENITSLKPLKLILSNILYLSALYTLPSAVLGYIKRWRSVKWFCAFSLVGMIPIILLHYSLYVAPDIKPTIFPYDNNLSIIWISIYVGTLAILALTFLFSIIFTGNVDTRKKDSLRLYSGQLLFETPAAIIYTIITLIMCMLVCIIPNYNRAATSEEAVAIMIIITYLFCKLWSKISFIHYIFLFSSVYFILFCYGGEPQDHIFQNDLIVSAIIIILLCLSVYTLFHSTRFVYLIRRKVVTKKLQYGLTLLFLCSLCLVIYGKLTQLIGVSILFGLLYYSQLLIWGKTSFPLKNTLLNVCMFILLVILYIGFNPICIGFKISNVPFYKTMTKWDYIVTQKDSLYGLSDAISGKEIIPCVFDSVGRGYLIMKLQGGGEEFLDSTIDIHYVSQLRHASISSNIYRTYSDSSGFYFFYPILLDKKITQESLRKGRNIALASRLYLDLRNELLLSLRKGEPMGTIHLTYAKELFKEEDLLLDSILIAINKKGQPKGSEPISDAELKEYTLHMARQLSVASIIDAVVSKKSNLCMWELFNTYSSTYFADIYDLCKIRSQWNIGLNLNGNFENYNFSSEGVRNGELQSIIGLWKYQYATNLKYMSYDYQLMMDESKQTLAELSEFGFKTNKFLNYELQRLSLGVYKSLEEISEKMKSGKMLEAVMDIIKTSKNRKETIEQVQYDFERYFILRDSINQKPLMSYRCDTSFVDKAAYKNFERLNKMNEISIYNYGAIKNHYIDNVILLSMNMKSPNNAVQQLEQTDSIRNGNTYNFIRSFSFLSNMYEIQKAEIKEKGYLVQEMLNQTKELLDKMPFGH